MAEQSGISWTDATFNPWWGCWPVSPGCALCYAEREATRHGFPGLWEKPGPGAPPESNRRTFGEKHWNEPRVWARNLPRKLGRRPRVFCASMADIGEDHPVAEQGRPKLWRLIEETPELDWLLLTKRTATARLWLPWKWLNERWPAHVWFGFSAEDQPRFDARWPEVARLEIPGIVFCSYEPALGAVCFAEALAVQAFDWLIVGGESAVPAAKARPAHPDWFRSARDQCQAAGVPFHFKQWGEYAPAVQVPASAAIAERQARRGGKRGEMLLLGRKATANMLDGRTWNEFPVSLGDPPGGLCFDLPKAAPRG